MRVLHCTLLVPGRDQTSKLTCYTVQKDVGHLDDYTNTADLKLERGSLKVSERLLKRDNERDVS